MNPWHILGWFCVLLATIATTGMFGLLTIYVISDARRRWWAWQDADVPPRAGQVWVCEGRIIRIEDVRERVIKASSGAMTWHQVPERWELYKKQKKLYLLRRKNERRD